MADDPYFIYLGYNNQAEGWRIPVNPESIEIKDEGQSKTYNIVGKGGGTDETRAGEINIIKSPKLKEVTFSSIFPAQVFPSVIDPHLFFEPMKYVKDIRRWMETKHPIRFIFVGHHAALETASDSKEKDLNFPASIESFEWREVAGSPGDIDYTLRLKEYVFYSARLAKPVTLPSGETVIVQEPPDRPDERVRPETYTLQKDEGLRAAAKRVFGDDSRWKEIQELNGIPDHMLKKLPIGMVLKIPQD
ncbi:LysM peptidoglycan-binding domain-containing protein [Paenibacillus vulneris]|uniref:LysM peptidoglycan-binding domain-containing protein n=1 Tax=Paenibacillus vulneris TaxID=1133364 RepID=A0ABW3V176_9BACL